MQEHCAGSVDVQLTPVLFWAQTPLPQQVSPTEQGASIARQAVGGTSQKQATDPGPQVCSCSNASVSKQPSDSGLWQQSALDEQLCDTPEQVGGGCGGVQIPELQVSLGSQQGSVRQEKLVPAQVEVPPLEQVPLVAPAGMSQVRPLQQSPVTVQEPASAMHGVTQTLPSQAPEQHCASVEQLFPGGAQLGPHTPELHAPKQQGLDWLQVSPCSWQSPVSLAQR
jgi:hypothetical protein